MNYAIRLKNIGNGHGRKIALFVLQNDPVALHPGSKRAATDRLERGLAVSSLDFLLQFRGADSARNHVVGQDFDQRIFVLRLYWCLPEAQLNAN